MRPAAHQFIGMLLKTGGQIAQLILMLQKRRDDIDGDIFVFVIE